MGLVWNGGTNTVTIYDDNDVTGRFDPAGQPHRWYEIYTFIYNLLGPGFFTLEIGSNPGVYYTIVNVKHGWLAGLGIGDLSGNGITTLRMIGGELVAFGPNVGYAQQGTMSNNWLKMGVKAANGQIISGVKGGGIFSQTNLSANGNAQIFGAILRSVGGQVAVGIGLLAGDTLEIGDSILHAGTVVQLGGLQTVDDVYNPTVLSDSVLSQALSNVKVNYLDGLMVGGPAVKWHVITGAASVLCLRRPVFLGLPSQSTVRSGPNPLGMNLNGPAWPVFHRFDPQIGACTLRLAPGVFPYFLEHAELGLSGDDYLTGMPVAGCRMRLVDALSNQVFDDLTDSDGKISFSMMDGIGNVRQTLANAPAVCDYYKIGTSGSPALQYAWRHRSPYTLYVNEGSVLPQYAPQTLILRWPYTEDIYGPYFDKFYGVTVHLAAPVTPAPPSIPMTFDQVALLTDDEETVFVSVPEAQ